MARGLSMLRVLRQRALTATPYAAVPDHTICHALHKGVVHRGIPGVVHFFGAEIGLRTPVTPRFDSDEPRRV